MPSKAIERVTPETFRTPTKSKPRRYTPEVAAEICARLMAGDSVTRICTDPRMPAKMTVFRWLADPKKKEFHEQYQLARPIQAEARVDEMFAILDDDSEDYITVIDKKGREVVRPNHEHVQRTNARANARDFVLAHVPSST